VGSEAEKKQVLQRLMFLSPLEERLGEGVMQETIFVLNPLT
jgi:hypothetical protein